MMIFILLKLLLFIFINQLFKHVKKDKVLVSLKFKCYISYCYSNYNLYIISRLAVSHYDEADNTYIASKEFTSEITCIWVDGIADSVTNEYLESHFSQFGPIHKCLINRFNKCALLYFQEVNFNINYIFIDLHTHCILLQSSHKICRI